MSISITVPMERKALTAAAKMFSSLADEMSMAGREVPDSELWGEDVPVPKFIIPGAHFPVTTDATDRRYDPETLKDKASPEVFATPEPELVVPQAPTAGLDVDSQGIPWDERIHSSSRATLARPAGAWKKKRGVTDEEIAAVEAELMAAVGAGAPEQQLHAASAPHPSVMTPPPPVADIPVMEVPPAPGGIDTFPQLISAISSRGISQEAVLKAVSSAGLQSLPLLAARPDLVPIVARVLGL